MKNKTVYFAIYFLIFPLIGALVGGVFYLIAKFINRNIRESSLEVFVLAWVLFFLFAGALGYRALLRMERLKNAHNKQKEQ